MNFPFIKMPVSYQGEQVVRECGCRICGEKTGIKIGIADYWDIKTCNIVACEKCGHIQMDPMLNEEETAKGCSAYYVEEFLRTGKQEQIKNCERNFRRGIVLGYTLKINRITPHHVLEFGPGSGYFAAGLQFIFPGAKITVMDVNRDVLEFNREHHGFATIWEIPDNFAAGYKNTFDLIIARDIIEHVTDIVKVLGNVYEYLQPEGIFHFITPNGSEDIWKHYLTYKLKGAPSELLINHVNYFNGNGLKKLLIQKGFNPVSYYTYGIKTTLRGQGWKEALELMNPVSDKKEADYYIRGKTEELKKFEFRKEDILDKWYIKTHLKWFIYLYSLLHHFSFFRIAPERNFGHEIYGLFKKT